MAFVVPAVPCRPAPATLRGCAPTPNKSSSQPGTPEPRGWRCDPGQPSRPVGTSRPPLVPCPTTPSMVARVFPVNVAPSRIVTGQGERVVGRSGERVMARSNERVISVSPACSSEASRSPSPAVAVHEAQRRVSRHSQHSQHSQHTQHSQQYRPPILPMTPKVSLTSMSPACQVMGFQTAPACSSNGGLAIQTMTQQCGPPGSPVSQVSVPSAFWRCAAPPLHPPVLHTPNPNEPH